VEVDFNASFAGPYDGTRPEGFAVGHFSFQVRRNGVALPPNSPAGAELSASSHTFRIYDRTPPSGELDYELWVKIDGGGSWGNIGYTTIQVQEHRR
jgi:hypothetical protein